MKYVSCEFVARAGDVGYDFTISSQVAYIFSAPARKVLHYRPVAPSTHVICITKDMYLDLEARVNRGKTPSME